MTYNEFVEGINDPKKIKQIDFYIDGYNHYRNCKSVFVNGDKYLIPVSCKFL